jgi:hypothetical protein
MDQLQLSSLPRRLYLAYYQFFNFLFVKSGQFSSVWLSIAHLICGVVTAFGLVRLLANGPKRTRLQTALLIVMLGMIPLWLNSIYLTNAAYVHDMMVYGICCLYILAVLTWSLSDTLLPDKQESAIGEIKKKSISALISWVVLITVLFSSLSWSVYTNQGYFILQTKYENLYALCERVVNRIETDPLYKIGMPVAVLGTPDENYPATKSDAYRKLDFAVGFGADYDYEYLRSDLHFKEFVRVYLGVSFAHLDSDTIVALKDTKAFQQMPSFPYTGCIALIDETLVVKMGNDNHYGWK